MCRFGSGRTWLCVEVVEEFVADCDGVAGGLGDGGPEVKLLWDDAVLVVVAEKGGEGAECCPPCAKELVGIVTKTADVGANHGDLVESGKFHDLGDGDQVGEPVGEVVACPFPDLLTRACEGGASNDHRSFGRTTSKHSNARSFGHHAAVHVVSVVFDHAVVKNDIGVCCQIADTPGRVLDVVSGVDEISARKTSHVASAAGLAPRMRL